MKLKVLGASVLVHVLLYFGLPAGESFLERRAAGPLDDLDTRPVELIEISVEVEVETPTEIEIETETPRVPEPEVQPPEVVEATPPPRPQPQPATPKSAPKNNPEPSSPATPSSSPTAAGDDGQSGVIPSGTGKQPRRLKTQLSNANGSRPQGAGAGASPAPPAPTGCTSKPTKPTPKTKVPIVYPDAAARSKLAGTLVMRASVSASGRVTKVEVLKSVGAAVDGPAKAALARWVFVPAEACGTPVASSYVIAREFGV